MGGILLAEELQVYQCHWGRVLPDVCGSTRPFPCDGHGGQWSWRLRELAIRYCGERQTLAALMTCRPLPFPSDAPSIIPGRSRIWISAPAYSSTPGIAVRVVKEYAATSDFVLVILERKVDLPTEGKPTSAIRASPDFDTSKPEPAPAPAPGPGSRSCALSRASFLFQS